MKSAETTVYQLVREEKIKKYPNTDKLNEIRNRYGYDLYMEALQKVTAEIAREKTIEELWMAACSGDMETLKDYYKNGGEVNRRYSKFGINHSLIAGAYRNGNFAIVSYLYEVGETPEEHEKQEVKFSPFAVVVIRQNGDTEKIGFTDKEYARKIYRCMCEIAAQDKAEVICTTLDELGNEKEKVLAKFSTSEKAQEYIEDKEQEFADTPEIYTISIKDKTENIAAVCFETKCKVTEQRNF